MKRIFKILGLLLVIVLATQGFGFETIKAANKKISTPKVSAKVSQKKKSVKITIDKTEGVSWYVIEMCNTDIDTQYTKVKKLKKDGTAKRSYTKKNLEDGTYLIRVRAYAKNGKKTIKSEYSEVITVNVGKTLTPEQDLDSIIKAELGDYMENGIFVVHKFGLNTDAQAWLHWDTSVLYLYDESWYVQLGCWADWANTAGVDPSKSYISIGKYDPSYNDWNRATYSFVFDTGEKMECYRDNANANAKISKQGLIYLSQVVAAMKNNPDPNVAPNIPGIDFRPCEAENTYIQY